MTSKGAHLARDLPDDALGLIGKLPELLKTIGSGLAEAGEQAAKAAGALVGDDGEGGARKALAGSATTMRAARDRLKDAAGMLSGLAGELDKIPGIGDAAAKKLTDGSGQIGSVANEVESLTGNLQDLSGSSRPSATRSRDWVRSSPSPAARSRPSSTESSANHIPGTGWESAYV